jgi:hypothetical protein
MEVTKNTSSDGFILKKAKDGLFEYAKLYKSESELEKDSDNFSKTAEDHRGRLLTPRNGRYL